MNSVIIFFVILGLHSSYSKVNLNIQGPVATVFTPMNYDQTVNFEAIPRYAHYLHNNGVKTVIVGDIVSEFTNLSLEDAKYCTKEWVDICKRLGIYVIVQVGGAPFVEVIKLAKYAASLEGVLALLSMPDLVMKPGNVTALVDNMALIADAATHLPLIYDHVPSITGLPGVMPEFVKAATRKIRNFGGVRYVDTNMTEIARVLNNIEKGQVVLFSNFDVIAGAIALGIKSAAASIYNIFPRLIQQIFSSQTSGDSETAMEKNRLLAKGIEIITSQGRYLPTMKATLEIVSGLPMGPPALPLRQISNETAEYIRQGLFECGLLEYDYNDNDKY